MTAITASRPEMPGYNPLDMDDVHTPSSRYCFPSFYPLGRSDLLFKSISCTANIMYLSLPTPPACQAH